MHVLVVPVERRHFNNIFDILSQGCVNAACRELAQVPEKGHAQDYTSLARLILFFCESSQLNFEKTVVMIVMITALRSKIVRGCLLEKARGKAVSACQLSFARLRGSRENEMAIGLDTQTYAIKSSCLLSSFSLLSFISLFSFHLPFLSPFLTLFSSSPLSFFLSLLFSLENSSIESASQGTEGS